MAYRDEPDGDDLGAGSTGTLPAGDCWPTAGQWPVPERRLAQGRQVPAGHDPAPGRQPATGHELAQSRQPAAGHDPAPGRPASASYDLARARRAALAHDPVPDRQPVPDRWAPSIPDFPPAGTHWPAGEDYWPGSESSWRPGGATSAEDGTLREYDAPYDYEDGRA
jgi:hypothetical protein